MQRASIFVLQDWIRRALMAVALLSAAGLVVTMGGQVFMRYVLESSLMGAEELSTLFGLWLYFGGFALVSAENQHIRGGFLMVILPEAVRNALERFFHITCAAIAAYFFWLTLDYAQFIIDTDRRSTFLRLPSALWIMSLAIGLALSAFSLLLHGLGSSRVDRP